MSRPATGDPASDAGSSAAARPGNARPLIRVRALGFVLGQFLLLFSVAMLAPLLFTLPGSGEDPRPVAISFAVTFAAGAVMRLTCRRPRTELSLREAILLVVATWVLIVLFGCLPFWLSPQFGSFTDAFYESMSGFTTTGASILTDVESLPRNISFWRCFTHWLGGMGIVMLGIAVLPLVGVGGMTLYRAQFAGAKSEVLKPRIIETVAALWKVYVALTLAEYIALRFAGMSSFDAMCHSFSTVGTGGFSTRNASIGAWDNPAIPLIVILFMILASINFARQYQLWVQGRVRSFFADTEVKFHLSAIAIAAAVVSFTIWLHDGYTPGGALLHGLFQVTSIITCTGFSTADFERWYPLCQLILVALMYVGGNTGSTAGGIKSFRIALLLRVIGRSVGRFARRRAVVPIRMGGHVMPERAIEGLLSLVQLCLMFNLAACILMAAAGVDFLTNVSAVASAMFGVGPGLGMVGPAENYAGLPAMAKWVLSATMLVGRLEFFTALAILSPSFWKK